MVFMLLLLCFKNHHIYTKGWAEPKQTKGE